MKFGRILTITLAAMLASAPAVQAQDEDLGELTTRKPAKRMTAAEEELNDPARIGPYLGAGAVYALETFSNVGMPTSDSGGFNVRVGYRYPPHVAGELQVESYPQFDGPDGNGVDEFLVNGWNVGGNVRGYILKGKFQPFVLMGVNYMDMETTIPSGPAAKINKQDDGVGMRFGGGMEIYAFQKVAVTADISYVLGLGEVDGYDLVAFSLGFIFRP
jgi:opacity protein-like surface antigen